MGPEQTVMLAYTAGQRTMEIEIEPVTPSIKCTILHLRPGGGGTQYKSGYRDVPQTWVAKSGRQVHQWVPFFQKHGTLMGLFFKIF